MQIEGEGLLWSGLCCLMQLQEIELDKDKMAQAKNELPKNWQELPKWGKGWGMSICIRSLSAAELSSCREPVMVRTKDGRYLILGRSNEKQVMTLDVSTGRSGNMGLEELAAVWTGECLLLRERFSWRRARKKFGVLWFLPFFNKYRRYLAEVLAASFFLQCLGIVTPICTQVIIDKVIGQQGIATLTVLGAGLAFAAFFTCGMNMARKFIEISVVNKIDVTLGSYVMHHLLALPLRYFEVRRVGDTLTRVSALTGIRDFFTRVSLTAFLDAFFSVTFFLIMAYYSVSLTLLALLPLPLYLVQNIGAAPVFRKRLEEYWQAGAVSNAFLVESVTGIQTVKAMAVEPSFIRHWEHLLARSVSSGFNSFKLGLLINTSASSIQNFSTLLILLAGGHQVMDGTMTIGQLIAFQMLARQGSEPLYRLSGIWQQVQQALLSVQRLGDIMNARCEVMSGERRKKLQGSIEFNNVSFYYDAESAPAVDNVSFKLQAGQSVGIVGPSGSGKSTIAKLVEQLYLPFSGEVLIDGIPAGKLDKHWLRSRIGVVQQESVLFRGSVRDNIAFSRPGAGTEQVMQAAELAGAHEFILELPDGYDTQVGEQGNRLSGGQRQRVAIARALLANPEIIIFDEATSALDYQSERIVMNNLKRIASGRTLLMVAHRLSSVRDCDCILVMEKGRMVEAGNHQQLMEKQGLYYSMFRQQEG